MVSGDMPLVTLLVKLAVLQLLFMNTCTELGDTRVALTGDDRLTVKYFCISIMPSSIIFTVKVWYVSVG